MAGSSPGRSRADDVAATARGRPPHGEEGEPRPQHGGDLPPGYEGEPPPRQVVPGNRWDLLDVPAIGRLQPRLTLSVVIPHYQAPAALERTLASLAAQRYPRALTEVLVVDDGSTPPLVPPRVLDGLQIRVIHRPDEGFTLARARHEGALAATGEVLVFLDADMLCEPHHLEAHARWHHVCDHAVTLGSRRHVAFPVEGTGGPTTPPLQPDPPTAQQVHDAAREGSVGRLFAAQPSRSPAWLDRHLARTAQLTSDDDDLFRVVAGGNLAVRRDRYLDVGGFDVSFTQWGSEDTDLGHRLFLAGALLVPEPRAACWHQGDSDGLEPAERRSLEEQRARISQTIAHPHFRRMAHGRTFRVPYLVVEVEATAPADRGAVLTTVESVLASDLTDLGVLLSFPPEHPDAERLRRELSGDARVRSPEDEPWLLSPYRCRIDPGVSVSPGALRALLMRSGEGRIEAGVVTAQVPGAPHGHVELRATRAVGRARTAGATTDAQERALAARWFGAREVDGADLGIRYDAATRLERLRRIAAPPAIAAAASPDGTSNGATSGDHTAGGAPPPGSRVAAWQLLDGTVGWQDRHAAADAVRAAEARATDAEGRADRADAAAREARRALDRVRARRVLRVTDEVARTGRGRPVRTLPSRLRSALTGTVAPPPRGPVAPPTRTTGRTHTGAASSRPSDAVTHPAQRDRPAAPAQHDTGTKATHRDAIPGLRVLHLGALCRFGTLAEHRHLTVDGWRAAIAAGADLLLVEPPPHTPGWDPLDGELSAVLRAARGAGIPTARIHVARPDTAAPGAADLEVVEAATTGADQGLPRVPPTVDTTTFNPRGWRHAPPEAVVATVARTPDGAAARLLAGLDPAPSLLVPPDLRSQLDPALTTPAGGVDRTRTVASPAHLARGLHRGAVLLDHPGWRLDTEDRFRSWLAALACGVPVIAVADGPGDHHGRRAGGAADLRPSTAPAAEPLRPPPGVLCVDTAEVADTVHGLLVDGDARERLAIAGRRFALGHADRRSAFVALLAELGVRTPAPLTTSVLLATHRPEQLDHALASVRRQQRGGVDVSLVLHGAGFDGVDVGDRGVTVAKVVRAPTDWTLGDCLNAAMDGAGGHLVTKMDDDDHYGPDHLTDLVLAWRHSGAEVVGKRIEFIHLVDRDVTLRRAPSPPERDREHVGGPTLLAAREDLRRFGFLRVPRRVDSTLYERVLAAGGRIYRTHSRDVVLSRRGRGHAHAWEVDDDALLAGAERTYPGLALSAASSAHSKAAGDSG